MSSYVDNLSPKEWEKFCEIMLRQHYGAKNFWSVPDQDSGDLGIEFYTIDGTIYQCYYPDKDSDMASYKRKLQKKIREDLKKLKTNEVSISNMLDDIKINHWVLLIPYFKSKDLITYCNKKKNEVKKESISYVNGSMFTVKIETADSFPDSKLYAMNMHDKAINIPVENISDEEKDIWKTDNSEFSDNIVRKSKLYMGEESSSFQNKIFVKYIQIEKFLDQLREEHPDLYDLIEDSALAQLENMKDEAIFLAPNKDFISNVVKINKSAFRKHSKFMSESNVQSLSFGYLSKWFAQCYMDFE